MDGFLSVPAGHLDGGENVWAAAQREISEEVGVVIPRSLEPAHIMHRIKKDEERIDFFFVIKQWRGQLRNAEPDKCERILWMPLNNLPRKSVIPYILFALKQIKANAIFSEYQERF